MRTHCSFDGEALDARWVWGKRWYLISKAEPTWERSLMQVKIDKQPFPQWIPAYRKEDDELLLIENLLPALIPRILTNILINSVLKQRSVDVWPTECLNNRLPLNLLQFWESDVDDEGFRIRYCVVVVEYVWRSGARLGRCSRGDLKQGKKRKKMAWSYIAGRRLPPAPLLTSEYVTMATSSAIEMNRWGS